MRFFFFLIQANEKKEEVRYYSHGVATKCRCIICYNRKYFKYFLPGFGILAI